MEKMDRSLITTGDGSHTLQVPGLGEHYHSIFGAITESRHIFIENGLRQTTGDLTILEAGFGTGLNVLLTWLEAQDTHRRVFYETWEKHPLSPEEVASLNYPEKLETERSLFNEIHEAPWDEPYPLDEHFTLLKVSGDFLDFHSGNLFNLVYYDAFGPDIQPDLWEYQLFQRIYHCLTPGAVLVTYSAKGQVRRNLTGAGFLVRKLPGPPGKREMIRAVKSQ